MGRGSVSDNPARHNRAFTTRPPNKSGPRITSSLPTIPSKLGREYTLTAPLEMIVASRLELMPCP